MIRRALAVALILLPTTAIAQSPPPDPLPSAAAVFERTLDTEGLEAALDSLHVVFADSGRSYEIDAYELGIGLPARLVVQHRREEALALVEAIAPLFGDHPRYPQELGLAHLRCGHTEEARAALARSVELNAGRKDLAWMVEHIEELAALNRTQAELEDRLVPGEPTGLHGSYMGQEPPGRTPEVFAPGYLNTTAHEYHISFHPDGREIVFSRSGVGTLVTRLGPDGWTVPEVIHLIDEDHLTEEANFTPDGQALVFCGRADIRMSRDLYRAEREGDGWGEPVKLFPGMYPTADLEGTLYYTARGEGRDYGAIVARSWVDGAYGEPVVVPGEGINSEFPDAHPWIAPDGNLLVFDSYREPDPGVYFSFRGDDGAWTPAVSVCKALDIPPVGQPAMSHDGKYLFFCLAGDMYWVDAGFMEEYRPR
jgi:hypothetical protein